MKIYIHKEGKNFGPFSKEELEKLLKERKFNENDYACHDGASWIKLREVPGFENKNQEPENESSSKPEAKTPKEVEDEPSESGLNSLFQKSKEQTVALFEKAKDSENLKIIKDKTKEKIEQAKSGKLSQNLKEKAKILTNEFQSAKHSKKLEGKADEFSDKVNSGKTYTHKEKGKSFIELDKGIFINPNKKSPKVLLYKTATWVILFFSIIPLSLLITGKTEYDSVHNLPGFEPTTLIGKQIKKDSPDGWIMEETEIPIYTRLTYIPFLLLLLSISILCFVHGRNTYLQILTYYEGKISKSIKKCVLGKSGKEKVKDLKEKYKILLKELDASTKKISYLKVLIWLPTIASLIFFSETEPKPLVGYKEGDEGSLFGLIFISISSIIWFFITYKTFRNIENSKVTILEDVQSIYQKILLELGMTGQEAIKYSKKIDKKKKKKKKKKK